MLYSTFISSLPLSNSVHHRRGLDTQGRSSRYCNNSIVQIPTCTASSVSRRAFIRFLTSTAASVALFNTLSPPPPSQAVNGLHIFPVREPLNNTYYLMRACETISDAAGIVAANPVDKLSIGKHSLTTGGVKNALHAADALEEVGVTDDCWIWPSVTMSAFQTAEVLASRLRVRRDHIVPEYSFLDARGVGALEGQPVQEVRRKLQEHDSLDPAWRPPPGTDGTPNDSVMDVWVRVNQLISKLETQYFAEDIVVVSPDSDTLSIWQASVTGLDLQRHSKLFFAPGEVRRVREVVVDAHGKVVRPPDSTQIFRSV